MHDIRKLGVATPSWGKPGKLDVDARDIEGSREETIT
jgi:hypothetical protein